MSKNGFPPTKSLLGPTSIAFQFQEYFEGQSVYPS